MHGDLRVLQRPQRMVFGQRLGIGDIEQRALDRFRTQRLDQRGLVDHVAARDIDQHRAGFHRRQFFLADHVAGLGSGRNRQHHPVELAQLRAPFTRLERTIRARAAHRHDLHVESFQPGLHQPADRAHPQQQHPLARKLALAGAVEQPFVPVHRAHHLGIALGVREHQQDDIFGDGQRIDARAIGNHRTALCQQIERQEIEPGVDRVEPFEVSGSGDDLRHRRVLREVEPADLGPRGEIQRLFLGHEPVRLHPVGQPRLDQRADHGGKDCFGHAGRLLWAHPIRWN